VDIYSRGSCEESECSPIKGEARGGI